MDNQGKPSSKGWLKALANYSYIPSPSEHLMKPRRCRHRCCCDEESSSSPDLSSNTKWTNFAFWNPYIHGRQEKNREDARWPFALCYARRNRKTTRLRIRGVSMILQGYQSTFPHDGLNLQAVKRGTRINERASPSGGRKKKRSPLRGKGARLGKKTLSRHGQLEFHHPAD